MMPLSGVREVAPLLASAPLLAGLDTEPFAIHHAVVVQVMYEIDDDTMVELLPRALHPTIPPTVTFVVWQCPEGPGGPFTLAEVRVGCRAGVRPRGFPLASYVDGADGGEEAARPLRERWGFECRPGTVQLRQLHDRTVARVEADGKAILQVEVIDPHYISGADIQYVANMNLARVPRGGEVLPRLVQVDPEFTFHRAQRGRPELLVFDRAAWNAEGVEPDYPVSATVATCDITLPRLRYLTNPDVPALQGTETVPHA